MFSMIKVIIKMIPKYIAKLDDIAFKGLASGGHRQDFQYVITKAIKEFIKKYKEKENSDNKEPSGIGSLF